jgi:hypothetical protein
MALLVLGNTGTGHQSENRSAVAAEDDEDAVSSSQAAGVEEDDAAVEAGADAESGIDKSENATSTSASGTDVLDVLREAVEGSHVQVEEVDAASTAAVSSSSATRENKLRESLLAAGVDASMLDAVIAVKMVMKKGQRQLPLTAPATSVAMLTFFGGRTDEQLETDCVKGVRNDGGHLGPIGMYIQVLIDNGVEASAAKAAAEAIAAKVSHRVSSIRTNVVATINELRRRRALAAGLNPAAAKYLRAR